ncbi:MAG: bifunctional oligoribonuclease/PAP phosphatase NrnA [Clostridia bacterium]|nr:bifunctional oligoribonuclease/PAP phosphatase NrnA [Clostridia bacterium]
MSTLDEIKNKIEDAEKIALLVHENPDGDAIGSGLAMYLSLKRLDKDVELIIPKYPRVFTNLPHIEEVKETGSYDKYDLAISLDCATIKLLNGWVNYFEDANDRIVIDHHSSNEMFGDINFVEPTSPACCQTLYQMFKFYNWEVDNEIGTCLMAGIITDTGGFQYSGVSKETFEIVSELIELGVNIPKLYKQLLSTNTKTSFELRKLAMDRMEFLEDGKITFTYITIEDEEKINAENGDYEGIVNEGRNIEGVEVSIFLHEQNDGFKASLRANEYVNVSDVCLMFGGGGHPRAAGAKFQGTPQEIKEKIVQEVKRQLK